MRIGELKGYVLEKQRLFTLGNFSAITGKGKSKKTFLASMMVASAANNGVVQDKFFSSFPESKKAVLHFDTEQGNYDETRKWYLRVHVI